MYCRGEKMRIGILGGTFDPIHMGHLIAAESAYDAAGLDQIILMPSGLSYFKKDLQVTDAQLRYEMTCAAAEGNAHFTVSDMETKRPGNSYTAVTLQELHRQRPEDVLYYIVGADTLVQMESWRNPETIFSLAGILVETRGDEVDRRQMEQAADELRQRYGASIQILPLRNIEISSTEIRRRVRDGRSIRYLVPAAVESFIMEHHLYRDQDAR